MYTRILSFLTFTALCGQLGVSKSLFTQFLEDVREYGSLPFSRFDGTISKGEENEKKSSYIIYYNASVLHRSFKRNLDNIESFCVDTKTELIVYLGTYEDTIIACGPHSRIVDLSGGIVMPGFVDSHFHLLYGGFMLRNPQLQNCSSPEEVVEVLKRFITNHPISDGGWLQGFGWDQNNFKAKKFPSRYDLDKAFPDIPVWLERIDGHAAWGNSAALRAKGVVIPKSITGGRIVRDSKGVPTGIFTDNAIALVAKHIPSPSKNEKLEALKLALASAARNGLTSIQNPGIDVRDASLFKEIVDTGELTLRHDAMWLGISGDSLGKAATPETPMIHNYKNRFSVRAVKFFMDGALGSWGASMLKPYSDRPSQSGQLRMKESEYRSNVSSWLKYGYQIATHAIGDRANRIVIDTYRDMCFNSMESSEAKDLRLRIEHFQIVNTSDIARIDIQTQRGADGEPGSCIFVSMQPTHATSDMTYAEKRLGKDRIKGAYAWRSILNSGAKGIAFGSDWPTVGKVPPLLGVYAGVTRKDLKGEPIDGWQSQECISRQEVLRGYTYDAAYAAFREKEIGSLEKGMLADFIVLDRDIANASTVPSSEIWKTQVLGTFVGGKQVWKHPCWGKPYSNSEKNRDSCPQRKLFIAETWQLFSNPSGVSGCPH